MIMDWNEVKEKIKGFGNLSFSSEKLSILAQDFSSSNQEWETIIRENLNEHLATENHFYAFLLLRRLPEDKLKILFDKIVYYACGFGSSKETYACRPALLTIEKEWVRERIRRYIEPLLSLLPLEDYSPYREILELLLVLDDREFVREVAELALMQDDYEAKEAGQDFLDKLDILGNENSS